MVEPLRHRQTKGAETDMLDLTPPRHVSTLPTPVIAGCARLTSMQPLKSNIGQRRHGIGKSAPYEVGAILLAIQVWTIPAKARAGCKHFGGKNPAEVVEIATYASADPQ